MAFQPTGSQAALLKRKLAHVTTNGEEELARITRDAANAYGDNGSHVVQKRITAQVDAMLADALMPTMIARRGRFHLHHAGCRDILPLLRDGGITTRVQWDRARRRKKEAAAARAAGPSASAAAAAAEKDEDGDAVTVAPQQKGKKKANKKKRNHELVLPSASDAHATHAPASDATGTERVHSVKTNRRGSKPNRWVPPTGAAGKWSSATSAIAKIAKRAVQKKVHDSYKVKAAKAKHTPAKGPTVAVAKGVLCSRVF